MALKIRATTSDRPFAEQGDGWSENWVLLAFGMPTGSTTAIPSKHGTVTVDLEGDDNVLVIRAKINAALRAEASRITGLNFTTPPARIISSGVEVSG